MNEALKLIMSSEALEAAISNYEARKAAMENTYLKISNEGWRVGWRSEREVQNVL